MSLEDSAKKYAPIVLSLLEEGIKAIAPDVADAVETFLPALERIEEILTNDDESAIKAEILAAQKDALDAAINAQLAALKD